MEEEIDQDHGDASPEERNREVDLNALYPQESYDLNRLFPDEATKKLLRDLKRNRRDIDRFLKSLEIEEE